MCHKTTGSWKECDAQVCSQLAGCDLDCRAEYGQNMRTTSLIYYDNVSKTVSGINTGTLRSPILHQTAISAGFTVGMCRGVCLGLAVMLGVLWRDSYTVTLCDGILEFPHSQTVYTFSADLPPDPVVSKQPKQHHQCRPANVSSPAVKTTPWLYGY